VARRGDRRQRGDEIPPDLADRAVALRDLRPGARRIDVLDSLGPALLGRLTVHGAQLTEFECAAFARRDCCAAATSVRRSRAVPRDPADGALLVDTGAGTTMVRDGHVELS